MDRFSQVEERIIGIGVRVLCTIDAVPNHSGVVAFGGYLRLDRQIDLIGDEPKSFGVRVFRRLASERIAHSVLVRMSSILVFPSINVCTSELEDPSVAPVKYPSKRGINDFVVDPKRPFTIRIDIRQRTVADVRVFVPELRIGDLPVNDNRIWAGEPPLRRTHVPCSEEIEARFGIPFIAGFPRPYCFPGRFVPSGSDVPPLGAFTPLAPAAPIVISTGALSCAVASERTSTTCVPARIVGGTCA